MYECFEGEATALATKSFNWGIPSKDILCTEESLWPEFEKSHNFGSRYARKPIKGSEDSDHSLVSKKILARWVCAHVQVNSAYIYPKRVKA